MQAHAASTSGKTSMQSYTNSGKACAPVHEAEQVQILQRQQHLCGVEPHMRLWQPLLGLRHEQPVQLAAAAVLLAGQAKAVSFRLTTIGRCPLKCMNCQSDRWTDCSEGRSYTNEARARSIVRVFLLQPSGLHSSAGLRNSANVLADGSCRTAEASH